MKPWWGRRNIRLTLALWYGAATIVVLAIYAASVFAFVSQNAVRTLDQRLQGDVQWAAEMVEQRPDGSLAWFERDTGDGESPWLQIWTRTGDLLYRSVVAERIPIAASPQWASQQEFGARSVVAASKVQLRLLSAQSMLGDSPLTIQVARPEAPMRREVRQLALILVLGLPLAVAAAVLGGFSLARRALAPVERMAERARTITAARLSERLPIENPDDELGQLAAVFNATLGRLEWSFEQMRRFTADVSHELRTPLTAIRSVGEVGLRGRGDERTYRGIIGSMLEEVDRLSTLVNRLLAFSRAETGQASVSIETIDVCALIQDVASLIGVLAEEKQQSLTVACEGSLKGSGDRGMLRQALLNIVDNALKYTQAGGTIAIRALESDRCVVVEVQDDGPGIADRLRGRIFERYHRGSAEPGGTGLGLAIARSAVEASGGRLTLEPASYRGSIFRITLPAAAGHQPPGRVAATAYGTGPLMERGR